MPHPLVRRRDGYVPVMMARLLIYVGRTVSRTEQGSPLFVCSLAPPSLRLSFLQTEKLT